MGLHHHGQKHHHNKADITLNVRSEKSRMMVLLGAIANIILSVIKIVAGWFGNSHALLADGLHSLLDLISDAFVYLAAKYGNQAADKEHPYGHERIETITTIFIAALLAFAALGIITDALKHITSHHKAAISQYVVWVAIISLMINEIVYRITIYVANKIGSDMLTAHAWHRRSDAAASLVVLIGIIGAMLGFAYLDGIAAIIVGIFIIKMAWKMGHQSFEELVDRGVSDKELAEIQRTIQEVDGVRTLHQLRTRLMAGRFIADVHILVDPMISVSEGHYIGDHVHQALANRFPNFNDITVHVDPEDDEHHSSTRNYPSRKKIMQHLEAAWDSIPGYHAMQLLAIHYLQDNLTLEIALPLNILTNTNKDDIMAQYSNSLEKTIPGCKLKIFYF